MSDMSAGFDVRGLLSMAGAAIEPPPPTLRGAVIGTGAER